MKISAKVVAGIKTSEHYQKVCCWDTDERTLPERSLAGTKTNEAYQKGCCWNNDVKT